MNRILKKVESHNGRKVLIIAKDENIRLNISTNNRLFSSSEFPLRRHFFSLFPPALVSNSQTNDPRDMLAILKALFFISSWNSMIYSQWRANCQNSQSRPHFNITLPIYFHNAHQLKYIYTDQSICTLDDVI